MLWLLSLRSLYDWMISLGRVSSSFLNFIDLLNFRLYTGGDLLYTFCVPQCFPLFFFAKSYQRNKMKKEECNFCLHLTFK
jgi:hypothetical protein